MDPPSLTTPGPATVNTNHDPETAEHSNESTQDATQPINPTPDFTLLSRLPRPSGTAGEMPRAGSRSSTMAC